MDTSDAKIKTGFPELDASEQGLPPGTAVAFSAQSPTDLDAFLFRLVHNIGVIADCRVLLFTQRQPKSLAAERLASIGSGVPTDRFEQGGLNEAEWAATGQAAQALYAAHVFVDDGPLSSVDELRARCSQLRDLGGADVLFLRYGALSLSDSDLRSLAKGMELLMFAARQPSSAKMDGEDFGPTETTVTLPNGSHAFAAVLR